jgi:ornithine cyclodeaminase/alanine dehydrogenase-like protein (mu-crystallin family)
VIIAVRVLDAQAIRQLVSMPQLIESLRAAFAGGFTAPGRQFSAIPGGSGDRLLLYMPAFSPDGGGAVKLVTLAPENRAKGLPTLQAALLVFSQTGAPAAVLDGTLVTRLRTGAASALAGSYLSRRDSSHLLVIGTGAQAPYMALGHCAVRPIRRVSVWGRDEMRAQATAAEIRSLVTHQVEVGVAGSREQAMADADIVSCATSCTEPVVAGKWLRPGTFLDLVGSFSASRREVDDEAVLRSRLFVDTLEGALSEAGDLLQPMRRGLIDRSRIEGELADLVLGKVRGRRTPQEIILFKSVGTAIEDLAAAQLIVAAAERKASADSR